MTEWLTVKEAAARMGVSTKHVYVLIQREGLPCYRLGQFQNSPIRIDAAELDRWVREQSAA